MLPAPEKTSNETNLVKQRISTRKLKDDFWGTFILEDIDHREEFEKTHENEVWIEIDRKGFQRWKDMTKEERCPYIFQAKVVNSAYDKTLLKEMDCTSEEDDEADSAAVGKFDLDYDDYYMYQGYDKAFESYDSFDYEVLRHLVQEHCLKHGGNAFN
ncbi:hypothetical protein ACLOJK_031417 [Asimina triloba]